jgi:putative inorganic carbon (HCO3(-)) transporter
MSRAVILHAPLALLCAYAAWLPLPFGSVQPVGHLVVQLGAVFVLATTILTSSPWPDWRHAVIPATTIAALAALGFLQSLPWPTGLTAALSPEHLRVHEQATAGASHAPSSVPWSLVPGQTRAAALTFLAVALCLLAAAVVAKERSHRRVIAVTLAASGLGQIIFGAKSFMTRTDTIWGVEVIASRSRMRGTFVNSDHCALYLELILALAFGWAWWALRQARREDRLEDAIVRVAPPVIVWLTLLAGIAFSGSRAGLMAALAATGAQGLLLTARHRRWHFGFAGVLAGALGLGIVATLGVQQAFGRWLATSQYDLTWNERLAVYGATIDIWQRFPLVGAGLGSFREAFPLVKSAAGNPGYWHAHNDWLELLATSGIVGLALLLVGLVVLIRTLIVRLRSFERSEDAAAPLAALGALVACAVHSLFDFGLTMPANAATLAIVCGCALGTTGRHRPNEAEATEGASPHPARPAHRRPG